MTEPTGGDDLAGVERAHVFEGASKFVSARESSLVAKESFHRQVARAGDVAPALRAVVEGRAKGRHPLARELLEGA